MPNSVREHTRRRFVKLGGLVGVTALAGCAGGIPGGDSGSEGNGTDESGSGEWPMFQYDAGNTGFVPSGTGPSGDVIEQRQFDVGVIDTPPRAGDGILYVPGNDLVALAPDGTEQWSVGRTLPPLTIGEKYVYTRDQTDRTIQIISREDGTILEDNIPGDRVSDIVFVDGTVYIGYERESPRILSARSQPGEILWEFDIEPDQQPERVAEYAAIGPVVSDGVVYVLGGIQTYEEASPDWTVYAISASDGSQQWSRSIAGRPTFRPTVTNETVYVSKETGPHDTTLQALSTEDGTEQWRVGMERGKLSTVAVAQDTLYVTADAYEHREEFESAAVYALSISDGTERWSTEMELRLIDSWIYGVPIVVDGTLYLTGTDRTFGERGRLIGLSTSDGSERWRIETDSRLSSSPVISGGNIYVGSEDGKLRMYS